MLLDVIEFNRERNGFKYDSDVEIKMYNEEVQEFFDATTTAERLDALIDCEYVRFGTQVKMAYHNIEKLPYDKSVEQIMVSVLLEEIPKEIFDTVLREAEAIVCEINATKPNELDEGKVIKCDGTANATEVIEVMLQDTMIIYMEKKEAQEKQMMEKMEDYPSKDS